MSSIKTAAFNAAKKSLESGNLKLAQISKNFQTLHLFEVQNSQEIKELRIKYIPILRAIYEPNRKTYIERGIKMETFVCEVMAISATQYKSLTKVALIILSNPEQSTELLNMSIQDVCKNFQPEKDCDGKSVKDEAGNLQYVAKTSADDVEIDELAKLESDLKKAKDKVRALEVKISELKAVTKMDAVKETV